MSFEWPLALAALLVLPLAALAYALLDRRRHRDAARFATPALLPNVVHRSPGRLRHLPAIVAGLAATAMLVGVARPHADLAETREEATVVLVVDVSRSMTADDVKPTRLVAARRAARRFLDEVPDSYRVGLVAFGTRADVALPATADRELARAALASLRPGEGTALGEGIVKALELIRAVPAPSPGTRAPAAVLLLSDGAQTQGDVAPLEGAQQARRMRVPFYTVSLGTPDGIVERTLPGGFQERIRVPPDPDTLREVASTTGGEFFAVADEERLAKVYEELGTRLARTTERKEVTAAFAAGGAVLLLAAAALSLALFRRLP